MRRRHPAVKTAARGHPGGPDAGELAQMREERQYKLQQEMPEVQKMIESGDREGAITQFRGM